MPVKPSVAAALLTWASLYDNRSIVPETATAWAEALDENVTLVDGKAAITAHANSSGDYLKPAHVNAEVRRIRKERVDRIGDGGIPPAELADRPHIEATWKREFARAVGDGDQPDVAEKRACDAVGIEVPAQIEPTRRPEEVRQLMAAHGPQCECGCLTRPVRREEGKA